MAEIGVGTRHGLSERQPLTAPQSESTQDASEKGRPRGSDDRIRHPKEPQIFSIPLQVKDLAFGVPLIGSLILVALLVYLSTHTGGGLQAQTAVEVVAAELRRADQDFQENLRQRESVLSSGMKGLREKHPAGAVVDLWFCPPYPCPDLMRIGQWGEGGKWVCNSRREPNANPVVISIGSFGDVSFEQEMARRLNAFSHTFDFTLSPETQKAMNGISFLKFYDAGLAGKSEVSTIKNKFKDEFPNATILTIGEVMQRIGLERVDILKMDCELCEYAVVKDLVQLYTEETVPFGQILVEIHEVLDYMVPEVVQFVKSLEGLGYRMFHSELNPYYRAGFELAFIHSSVVKPF